MFLRCSPSFIVHFSLWFTCLACAFVPTSSEGQEKGPAAAAGNSGEASLLRIAVVDMTRVFKAHPQAARAQAALDKERAALREVFKKKSEALKKALQEHQELIRVGKKDEGIEKLREVNTLEKEIATLRSTQQRALEQQFADQKSSVLESIRESVAGYNDEARYGLIIDASAAAANGLPTVLDARGADDITDAIIARVKVDDAKAEAAAKKAEGDKP